MGRWVIGRVILIVFLVGLFSRNATFGRKQCERHAALILTEDSLRNRWLPGHVGSVASSSALLLPVLSRSSFTGNSSRSPRLSLLYHHVDRFKANDILISKLSF